jgi:predicted nuclease of restriction endonuclease-like (RecB) superfamily
MASNLQAPIGYSELLQEIKERIRSAQVQASLSVNRELILLYWSIGRDLSQRFQNEGWGTKINERLAKDLQAAFPGVEGFSPRNLRYMRAFAEAWPEQEILQQLIAKLPWGHNLRVLDRVKDRPTREWYLRAALEFGWSQNVLVHMISGQLHEREGKALTNFHRTLPPPGSDMAEQILRDPYNFEFLTLSEPFAERELEKGLLTHLRDLLLELAMTLRLGDQLADRRQLNIDCRGRKPPLQQVRPVAKQSLPSERLAGSRQVIPHLVKGLRVVALGVRRGHAGEHRLLQPVTDRRSALFPSDQRQSVHEPKSGICSLEAG